MQRLPTRSLPRPLLGRSALVALLLLAAGACDPGFAEPASGETISEDTFVEVMVELRRAAAHWEFRRIPEEERNSILAEYGLGPEDLLRFAEIHGRDVPRMNRVWTRVEARLTGRDEEVLEAESPDAQDLVEEGILPEGSVPEFQLRDEEPEDEGPGELPPGEGGPG